MPRMRAVYASFRHQMLHFMADPQWLIPNLIAPFVLTLVAIMLYKSVSGPVVLYAILGGGMMGMWGNTLYASGFSIGFDRWNGTLEAIFAVPTKLIWIIGGRALWNSLLGILNGFFIFVIAEVVFRVPITLADPVMFFLAFFLTLLSLATLGLLFSAAFVLTRSASVLTNGLEFPIYVGTGTMFPIAFLPFWTHPLSLSLGPSWGIDAIRLAATADPSFSIGMGFAPDIAIMIALSALYLLLAVWLFGLVDKKARKDGSLVRF
jgi:ABC-type multidrug transport system permease subunit